MRLIPDHTWAILTLWQEARGETDEGRIAVAEVIRNRTMQRYSSQGTVASTVLWPWQFSGWNTRDPNRTGAAMLDDADPSVVACGRAWDVAAAGSNLTQGAVLYYNPAGIPVPPPWVAQSRRTVVIGRHHFFVPR